LRDANVRRWPNLYATEPRRDVDKKTYSMFGFTWAFKTWILESFRVGANDYYKRHRRYPCLEFQEEVLSTHDSWFFYGRLPTERLTPDENEARSDWWASSRAYFDGRISEAERVPRHIFSLLKCAQATPSYGHNMATPNWKTPMPSHPGKHDIGHCLVYENVDPGKVRRGNYVECMELLLNPYDVYLDCHMMGYMVPNYFWRQLVPHLCMPGSHSLARANQEGWLSNDHMNALMELLIRGRT
ncbi:hypothetical protein Tco_1497363, partial [Tanacetum coccineum]